MGINEGVLSECYIQGGNILIFITLGSQKFQFNRLLYEIDKLLDEGKIVDKVFAQIGYSDYRPQKYEYKEFLDRDEFNKVMKMANIVMTHGGTGAIIGAIKQGKKVIAVPRLSKYGEHVDDHQIEITNQFKEMNLIECVEEIESLGESISKISKLEFNMYQSNTDRIIEEIEKFILEGS